ncbi:hypothetical protein [Polymorphobacter megasporae]|uniref:hypothetical protein n=1 Tax=Glacieibacterium megasporae TaxID=2835787 RepID=UPI001C1E65E3|nr:hypothetical protein [Polymorphobacter megasporae]UAJ12996.1 hypothetical protein KTC28_22450 [Polymorphobacter megasporae]
MAEDYEREKLGNAVNALAVSAAPIQKRLEYAWTAMHTLMSHGFTDLEREAEFAVIKDRLTADKSDEHMGYVPTTCAKLSDNEAMEIAQAIVDLKTRLYHNRIHALEDELEDLKGR